MQWRAFKNQDVSKIGEEDVMKRDDDFSCYRAICVIMKRFSFCHVPLFVYLHESLDVSELFKKQNFEIWISRWFLKFCFETQFSENVNYFYHNNVRAKKKQYLTKVVF